MSSFGISESGIFESFPRLVYTRMAVYGDRSAERRMFALASSALSSVRVESKEITADSALVLVEILVV
jgi:hypothetical protein